MGGTEGERDLVASDMVEIMKKRRKAVKREKQKGKTTLKPSSKDDCGLHFLTIFSAQKRGGRL